MPNRSPAARPGATTRRPNGTGKPYAARPEEHPVPSLPPEPGSAPEPPAAPTMPSFDSLRDHRRRTAVDLLVPGPSSRPATATPPPGRTTRPPEWADLWLLGLCVARTMACVPVQMASWWLRQTPCVLRRLLGD